VSDPQVRASEAVQRLIDHLGLKACATGKVAKQLRVVKANVEEQTLTGIVLEPETVDGQGDIYDASVIRSAAHRFLANFNRGTKLGLQHKVFKSGQFALAESYLAPANIAIGSQVVKEGSWVMVVKVLDHKLWKDAKAGKITGFSIGGRAKVKHLADS
jgi:DNA adenine methylase